MLTTWNCDNRREREEERERGQKGERERGEEEEEEMKRRKELISDNWICAQQHSHIWDEKWEKRKRENGWEMEVKELKRKYYV